MERECDRVGKDYPGQGRPKREIREGTVGENINEFKRQTCTFDYCTCMIGRLSVGVVFLDLHCKPVVCCLSIS